WKYKEGASISRSGSSYDEKIAWLRRLLAWQDEMSDSGEMLDELRSQVFDDRVYVFTPKGDVVDLPIGATPLDFAYHIHSEVGHRCIGAKVGGRIVPFTYQLNMGDQVDIITQKEPAPSRDWLNPNLGFVTSGRARAKLNAYFRRQAREKNIQEGKEILLCELGKIGASAKDASLALKRFYLNSLDDLYAGVGNGDLRINQIINFINSQVNKVSKEQEDNELVEKLAHLPSETESSKKAQGGAVVVEGIDNLLTHLARCCQPIPGDLIQGYVTQGRGISVHRAECEQLAELRTHAPERIIDTVWCRRFSGNFAVTIRVTSSERNGLVKDLNQVFTNEKSKILGLQTRVDYKKRVCLLDFTVNLNEVDGLNELLRRLEQVKEVHSAVRLK
ncbi:MAG: TGS domain-containing protein, partial [Enterovibrio sp.]